MKRALISVLVAASMSSAFAAEVSGDLAQQALKIVMKTNPKVESQDFIGSKRLSSIVAENMTSHFNEKNEGDLKVISNTCKTRRHSPVINCLLIFNISERVITKGGAYTKANGGDAYEGARIISYSIDTDRKVLVGKVLSTYAE